MPVLSSQSGGRRRDVRAPAWKSGARIFGCEPVHDRLDMVDLLVTDVVPVAQPRRHIDMRDVVAGRRIDAVERFEKHPVSAEAGGDLRKIGAVVAGKAVAQQTLIVAGIGMVKAGFAL